MPGRASSHREAPLIGGDPQADNTDLYAFLAPNDPNLVTIIASYIPFEDPMGGPNFYRFGDDVLYEIKIDNNGDAVEDITYQFRFKSFVRNPNTFLYNTGPMRSAYDPNRNMFQTYTVTRIDNGRVTAQVGPLQTMFDNTGFASVPDYSGITGQAAGIHDGGSQGRVFAGQTDDPFFLDLRVFDLLYGANLSEAGTDSLAGFNVHSIALQIPRSEEHTSELQSRSDLVCRLLLEKKKQLTVSVSPPLAPCASPDVAAATLTGERCRPSSSPEHQASVSACAADLALSAQDTSLTA